MDSQTNTVDAKPSDMGIAVKELSDRNITGSNVRVCDCWQALIALDRPRITSILEYYQCLPDAPKGM